MLSKIFDKDKDGKLNAEERRNADEAIRNGIDDKMVWGVEQSGTNRNYRLMQKRGKIINSEDF